MEQYENETKQKLQKSPSQENALFKQSSPTKGGKKSKRSSKAVEDVSDSMEFIETEKEDISPKGSPQTVDKKLTDEHESIISVGTSCSNSSTDDDWEKINDTDK